MPRTMFSLPSEFSRVILDGIRDSIVVLNSDFKVVSANQGFCSMFGLTTAEVLREYFYDLNGGLWDIPKLRQALSEVMLKDTNLEDYEIVSENSGIFNLNARCIFLPGSSECFVLLTIRDVTEQKKRETEARRSEARTRLLTEAITDFAIITLDRNGNIADWNVGAERLMGFAEEEALGKPGAIIFTEEDRKAGAPEKEMDTAVREGVAIDERWHVRKDGSRFWGSGTMSPFFSGGILEGFVKIFRDMMEYRKLTESLSRSNEELQYFADMASHDLQEPLRTIGNFTEILTDHPESLTPEETRKYIGHIETAALQAQRLVNDLLEYSRLGRNEAMEKVSTEQMLSQAVYNLGAALEAKKASLTNDPMPEVMGMRSSLARLFQNLLSNALKYCDKERPEVHVGAERRENDWLFSVSDNGIGIAPGNLERIFEMFRRLHNRSDYEGTGIGLTICRKIVEAHGGRIWAESEPGRGSTFYFTLPAVS